MRHNMERYNAVAVFLHWTMAILILGQLAVGLTMENYPGSARALTYGLHKSFGLVILLLSITRLGWRLAHPVPHMPAHMPGWQKLAARLSHWAFYALMIAMPLSGWIMVSADARHPTVFFMLAEVPQFPLPAAYDTRATHERFEWLHYWLAIGTILLLALHVAAALKHHFLDRDTVLRRMLPLWLQRRGRLVL